MRKFVGICISIPLVALNACSSRYQNVKEYKSKQGNCIVIIEKQWNDKVCFIDDNKDLVLPKNDLDCLGSVDKVEWSPSGNLFILVSYGEGDQGVAIYDINKLKSAEDRELADVAGYSPPYRSLDPYLHSLSEIEWVDNNHLKFNSIGNFKEFDYQQRRAKINYETLDDDAGKTWLWDLDLDTFTEVPSGKN